MQPALGRGRLLAWSGSSSPAPGSCMGLHVRENLSYFAFAAAGFPFQKHSCSADTPRTGGHWGPHKCL